MENNINKLLLDYAAHHAVNCEFFHGNTPSPIFKAHKKQAPGICGWEFYSYKQKHIANSLANCLLLVHKMLENKAKLLVFSYSDGKLQVYFAKNNLGPSKNVSLLPSLLQGGWISGACSNWSRLCKIAWNMMQLTSKIPTYHSDSWKVRKNYNLLQLAPKSKIGGLAYKHKPDCVLLINPSSAALRECKNLAIPLCILSSGPSAKISGCYLEANQESCFLTYLIINLIS